MKKALLRLTAAVAVSLVQGCVAPLLAQRERSVDRWSELWIDAGIRGKLGRGWRGIGELGYRTGDELARGRQFFLDAQVRRKLNKYVDAAFEQRVAFRFNDDDRLRSGLMVLMRERFGRFPLGYRLNYQHVWALADPARNTFRNKFEAGYDIRGFQLDPELSIEFFTELGGDDPGYDAVRYRLGTSWAFAKGQRLSFHVVHDREQRGRRPDRRWIFAFSYMFNAGRAAPAGKGQPGG